MTTPDLGWIAIALAAMLIAINVVRDIRRQKQHKATR